MSTTNTNPFIIAVDLDNTSVHYSHGLANAVGKSLGFGDAKIAELFPSTGPSTYDFADWPYLGEDFKKYHTQAVDNGLYRYLVPHEGASEKLWKMNNEGDYIRIITSRFVMHGQNQQVTEDTAYNLDLNNFPYRDLMFTARKTDIYADVYIDDAPSNIEKFIEAERPYIIFSNPWNEDCAGARAHNWEDVYELIQKLKSLPVEYRTHEWYKHI